MLIDTAQAMLWVLVLLPAVVGGVLAVAPNADRLAVPISLVTAGVGVAASLVVAAGRPEVSVPFMAGARFGLQVDGLSALMAPTVTVVTLLVLVFSAADVRDSRARFHGLMLLFAAAAALTATAATLPTLLLAWEVMGATSYALIGFWWRDDDRVSSGLTAFVTTRTADLGLYVAAGAALAGGAGLALADLDAASTGWRHVIALGIMVAALGKAAQLPFSFWLSRAMAGPSPVSALLHSAAMVALGGYLLLRVAPLLESTGWAGPVTAWVGVATALLLGVVAVAQTDLKQLLAASTSAQLGFVVMGAGLVSVSGGAAHLMAHAATKALLFLAAGAWLTAIGTKQLGGLHGVARRWPWVGGAATLGLLSLAGVAPLSLWATKDAVLAAALEESTALYVAGMAAAAVSAGYAAKALVVIWGRSASYRPAASDVASHVDREGAGTGSVSSSQQATLAVLAGGAVLLGLLALPPVRATVSAAVDGGSVAHASAAELAVSAGLALSVLAVVLAAAGLGRWPGRALSQPRWAAGWLGLESAADLLVVRPTDRLARALARFDDEVLDRTVDASASAVQGLAQRLSRFDIGGVDAAVQRLAAEVRRLGHLARRPQTGQLHQYYLQAVGVLAAGVAVLVVVR